MLDVLGKNIEDNLMKNVYKSEDWKNINKNCHDNFPMFSILVHKSQIEIINLILKIKDFSSKYENGI